MTEHTRRSVLRGAAAITAAGGLVATGGFQATAVVRPRETTGRHFPFL